MGKSRSIRIYLTGGVEQNHIWQLTVNISAKEHDLCGVFYLAERVRNGRKCKTIHLAGGREEGYHWDLKIDITTKQHIWSGNFTLAKRRDKTKQIYLAGATEKGYRWELHLYVSDSEQIWIAIFALPDDIAKNKTDRRIEDRLWANRTFSKRWLKRYERHHDWDNPMETCYFFTKEEHFALHQASPQR